MKKIRMKLYDGFTLIELIIIIVLVGILSVFLSNIILLPINNFFEINKRTQLVSIADQALYKIRLELSRALPYSVRVTQNGSVKAVEFYLSENVMRYIQPSNGATMTGALDISAPVSSFYIRGQFLNPPQSSFPFTTSAYNLYIYDSSGSNVTSKIYDTTSNVMTKKQITVTPTVNTANTATLGEYTISLSSPQQFSGNSPYSLIYFSKTPISYICDTSTGNITRIDNYTSTTTQPYDIAAAPLKTGKQSLLTKYVKDCSFYSDADHRFFLISLQLKDEISGTTTIQMYDLIFSDTTL